MASLARVLFVAADACDVATVRQLAAAGDLPVLGDLLATAATVDTEAPVGLFVGAAWLSVSTGLRADHHGYYTWLAQEPDGYGFRQTSHTDAAGSPFWERLGDGRRVAVLDFPHMVVPDPASAPPDSVLLAEWGAHDRHVGPRSVPPGFVDEINARYGAHYGARESPGFDQFAPCDHLHRAGDHRTPAENRALLDELRLGHDRKAAMSLDLLDGGRWDLFLSVVAEAHCVGHQLWHLHDDTHPWHDADQRRTLGDPVADIYRRVDRTLGRHLARADDDTAVYVLLSHGMTAHYDGTLVLDHLLDRAARLDGASTSWQRRLAGSLLDRLPDRARPVAERLVASAGRRQLTRAPAPPADGHSAEGPVGGADDRAARPWFQIPNNSVTGAIRLNVQGRQVGGVIPADDFEAACREVAGLLARVINLDTGEPAVREVIRVDDVYDRRAGDDLPDLLVEWNRSAPIERVWSPDVGTIVAPAIHWRTGDHTADGLLLARGPGIVPGHRPEPVGLEHLAPTVAASLGVELTGIDGEPLDGMVATRLPARAAR